MSERAESLEIQGIEAKFRRLTVESLSGQHLDTFTRSLSNVLRTEIAETTYAQIVDGFPLSSINQDRYLGPLNPNHPLQNQHNELCPGVLDRNRQLRTDFDLGTLHFNSRVSNLFEHREYLVDRTNPSASLCISISRAGISELQDATHQLVAVAVHQIAVWVYKQDTSVHKDDALGTWTAPEDRWSYLLPNGRPVTYFLHTWYRDYEQYPDGVADCVGYWAESRILGGVVLFDRLEAESQDVYSHPDRFRATYRICKLLDSQKQQFLEFLLHSPKMEKVDCPLPIVPTNDNRDRVDPEEPIAETGVYRDIWERKDKPITRGDYRLRDVFTRLDWPEPMEKFESARRARWKLEEAEYGPQPE